MEHPLWLYNKADVQLYFLGDYLFFVGDCFAALAVTNALDLFFRPTRRGRRFFLHAPDAVAAALGAHPLDIGVEDAPEFVSATQTFKRHLFRHGSFFPQCLHRPLNLLGMVLDVHGKIQ